MKVFLLLAITLVAVTAAPGKKGKGKGGKGGKCLSDEQAAYLCMEGTSLQAKMGPALTKCGMMPSMGGRSEEGVRSVGGSAETRAKVTQNCFFLFISFNLF